MLLSQEFRNMAEPNQSSSDQVIPLPAWAVVQGGLVAKPVNSVTPLEVLQNNADILSAVLNFYGDPANRAMPAARAAILYFPPGRYDIGRPAQVLPNSRTELLCDFVVPENVTLRFAQGATLVLANYERISSVIGPSGVIVAALRRREIPGRPEDVFKVRMEIQGTIEAGIQTIFDCVTTDLRDPANHGLALGDEHAAGHVYFTRNNVAREVFPEWFGATSDAFSTIATPVAFVRRTTMALQEAIRVAHGRRRTLAYAPMPDERMGVVGKYQEVFSPPLPRGSAALSYPGITLDGVHVLANGALQEINSRTDRPDGRWDFVPTYTQRPSIPITLTGSYEIDAELSIGYTLDESAGYDASIGARFPDRYHQPNTFGAVLRGLRGPGRQGAGSVALRAARTFQTRPPVVHVPAAGQRALLDSASLLAVRGAFGTTLEGIAFEGNLAAPRCVTLQVSGGGQAHSQRLADCALRGAIYELLHMGGDFPKAIPGDVGLVDELYNGNLHWSGNHDLLNSQVTRCAFDTGSAEERRALGVTTAPVGVMYRTGQSLSVEFSRCVFQGVAAPMFHAWSLRFTLRECAFETRHAGNARTLTAGADIFFDNPRNEGQNVQRSFPIKPAAAMIKNVTSRSPRFITTFTDTRRGSPIHAAVQLINVVHAPTLGPDELLRPAILWAGTARVFGRLVLIGCRFVRPRSVPRAEDYMEPVLVDLVEGVDTLEELEGVIQGARDFGSARGHVVDLGNRAEAQGFSVDLVASRIYGVDQLPGSAAMLLDEAVRLASAALDLRVLPIVDRYATEALTER